MKIRTAVGVCAVGMAMVLSACSNSNTDTASSNDTQSTQEQPADGSSASGPASGDSAADSSAAAGQDVVVGVDQPRSDSDFWSAYQNYVEPMAKEVGGITLERTASDNNAQKLIANVKTLIAKDVQAIVVAPQDTGSVGPIQKAAADAKIPLVTVDTAPDSGDAYMVVRANNTAYGTNACIVLGTKLDGAGTVVQFEGALDSVNGRERSEAFTSCMKDKFPKMKVISIPTNWEAQPAIAGLKNAMTTGDVNGIYSQAGGVYLAPTLTFLKQQNKLIPAGQDGHIAFVSNDGISAELDAIRKGYLDATVSQPADEYAKWSLYYAKAGAEGKTFQPGPTDHNSTIVEVRKGLLEDQVSAPVVTKDGATLGDLKTVQVDSKDLWGNS